MQKIREMIDANTIVGTPITTADGTTLIPVSKLSFGFAGGGGEVSTKHDKPGFGGGTGAGVHVTPIAFVVQSGSKVDMLYIDPPATSTVEKIIDAVPEVLDKITDFIEKE